jgi:hypothetical protein
MDLEIINFGNEISLVRQYIKPNFKIIKSKRFVNAVIDKFIKSYERKVKRLEHKIEWLENQSIKISEGINQLDGKRQNLLWNSYATNIISEEEFNQKTQDKSDYKDLQEYIDKYQKEVTEYKTEIASHVVNINSFRLTNACIFLDNIKLEKYIELIEDLEKRLIENIENPISILQIMLIESIYYFQCDEGESNDLLLLMFRRMMDKLTHAQPSNQSLWDLLCEVAEPYQNEQHPEHYYWLIMDLRQTNELNINDRLNFLTENYHDLPKITAIYAKKYKNFLSEVQLELILEWPQLKEPLQQQDNRITGKLSKEEVKSYFMTLTEFPLNNNDGKVQVLSEQDVMYFLHSNFTNFQPKKEPKKFTITAINNTTLTQFIYQFYKLNCTKKRTIPYIHLLKNNFSIFDEIEFDNLKKNFSR